MAKGCKAQSHNWQLQLNQTSVAIFVQVFDWSTTIRKVVVIAENTMSKSKTMLEMTIAGLDAPWETTTPLMHRSCNDSMIQLSPLSSYIRCLSSSRLVMHVLYTLSCSIPHTLWSTGFKSGEFGGHSRGGMNSGVSLLAKTKFFNDVTLYVIITVIIA